MENLFEMHGPCYSVLSVGNSQAAFKSALSNLISMSINLPGKKKKKQPQKPN